ncbi:unnamed protein product, partial [Iphiclides podalirius]
MTKQSAVCRFFVSVLRQSSQIPSQFDAKYVTSMPISRILATQTVDHQRAVKCVDAIYYAGTMRRTANHRASRDWTRKLLSAHPEQIFIQILTLDGHDYDTRGFSEPQTYIGREDNSRCHSGSNPSAGYVLVIPCDIHHGR